MIRCDFIDPDGDLFDENTRALVHSVCSATEREVRSLLPALTSDTRLRIEAGSAVVRATGDAGASVAPGLMTWTVDPHRPGGVPRLVQDRLRFALFHELHHQVRGWVMTGGTPPTTFMEAVVSEGLATAFERDAAGSKPPWGDHPANVRDWVDELLDLPLEAFSMYAQWMFHHPDGRSWIGYRAGTYIADLAIDRSGKSAAELVQTPTPEVLSMAGIS